MDNAWLRRFYKEFPTEEACYRYLEEQRWPDGQACPHCRGAKIYKYKDGRLHKCSICAKQFTAKTGTIFADSHIALQDWFLAVGILTAGAGPVSSVELGKQLGITQKSAWLMISRLRLALPNGSAQLPGSSRRKRPYQIEGSFEGAMKRLA